MSQKPLACRCGKEPRIEEANGYMVCSDRNCPHGIYVQWALFMSIKTRAAAIRYWNLRVGGSGVLLSPAEARNVMEQEPIHDDA